MINITVENKRFGDTEILHDIDLTIERGMTLALLGPSGIGKTTLLRLIAGLDTDFIGAIDRPENTTMVFQEPTLLPWRNALQNITLVSGVDSDEAVRALADVGLSDKERLFPGQLSLGQQRRLALARAFATKPDFLIMDEPFASLDGKRAKEMIALTMKLINAYGTTTLFVTHSEAEAKSFANRIVRMEGQPASLISDQ